MIRSLKRTQKSPVRWENSIMSERWCLSACSLLLICAVRLHCSQAVKVENVLTQSNFYQTQEPTGEYMFQFDEDEIFYVDLDKKETKWRLPQFGETATFEAAGALQNIGIMKHNLNIMMKRSNMTAARNVAPDIHLFPENPVVFEVPNTLICLASKFFPPVVKMSWMKNNQPVTDGVSETDFYPTPDGSFRKFLYLGFVPKQDDIYTCSVEHAGQPTNPTNQFWRPETSSPHPETSENIICGLGLAVGIVGIVAGIVLIFKALRRSNPGSGY
ncbi:RLA class II histocompatibility antigen, DP alpha-1 chain-like [Spea bombifrons]|uniref:RLA class II histocompatibility antigen, DP alpha-1 chain-like n=1 Tax=Spea bombifrons TaxID=233779 RepID=UPI00234998F1|nr:RLA class II histocompatibility antigen, DP alpha-1 chain-like [Spea bombifrons]XP_053329277.1 RLA class II histocompatibility antigen, DP alpha-1 chain-like [Spea bombifrons]